MLRFLRNLFYVPPSEKERKQRTAMLINSLIRRFSRGSVRLKQGRYMTHEDAEQLKRSALRCRF